MSGEATAWVVRVHGQRSLDAGSEAWTRPEIIGETVAIGNSSSKVLFEGRIPPFILLLARVVGNMERMLCYSDGKELVQMHLDLVFNLILLVVRTLVKAARKGLVLRDWHTGNIGFSDVNDPQVVLLDWYGNSTSNAPVSYKERIAQAFFCFCRSLVYKSHIQQWRD